MPDANQFGVWILVAIALMPALDTVLGWAGLKKSSNTTLSDQPIAIRLAEQFATREALAEVKVELKLLRRDLRQEIDSMENWLKLVNILGMPFLVAGVGISLAAFRYFRTSAR